MNKTTVDSVERAVQVLRSLEEAPRTLSELSRCVGIGLSGTLKLLRTLMEPMLIQRNEQGLYTLGPGCCILTRGYLRQNPISQIALPVIKELLGRMGTRVVLAVLDGIHQVDLRKMDANVSSPEDESPLFVGIAWPLATGRLLLAHAPEKVLQDHLKRYPLSKGIPGANSIKEFQAQLHRIRESELAHVRYDENTEAIAVPIRDFQGNVTATLGARVSADHPLEKQVAWLRAAAETISRRLGWTAPIGKKSPNTAFSDGEVDGMKTQQ